MLNHAYFYKDKLMRSWAAVAADPQFRFIGPTFYSGLGPDLKDNTWHRLRCVSLSGKGDVSGWFEASVDRDTYMASDLLIINMLGRPNTAFASGLREFMQKVFLVWNFQKMKFAVVIGNPAEVMYDRFITNYGGRVVGINYREIRLTDGKLYDMKLYEILREDCLSAIGMSEVALTE